VEALNNILNRVSARNLKDPHPSEDEMQSIYKAALRAPDHAWLRPSSFIEVKGIGISRLSKIFEEYADTVEDLKEEIKEKYKMAPFRAPMIIILVNTYKEHPKVPEIEQKLSTAAAAQNILLSLNAVGYAGIWRTGKLAFNPFVEKKLGLNKNQSILGYLYIGTADGPNKNIPSLKIDDFVKYL